MLIPLTQRAIDKNIKTMEVIAKSETENYIICIVVERRKSKKEFSESIIPFIVLKRDIKHHEFDQIIKIIEELNITTITPNLNMYRRDYLDIDFFGYKPIIQTFGSNIKNLPYKKRWKIEKSKKEIETWIPDIKEQAELIYIILNNLKTFGYEKTLFHFKNKI